MITKSREQGNWWRAAMRDTLKPGRKNARRGTARGQGSSFLLIKNRAAIVRDFTSGHALICP
ncbi:hypothetical protein BTK66_07680 [Cronobacter sakazakii]|uniref:Uncharacterized protein n=1 Tax=Cronobacter sakazakii TaxID=28141 RepID=A0AA45C117_CROSK|nr:hypothetical protein FZI10_02495 [Cronobacter sakazakii]KAB0868783.1 hypothetical protein FZH98_03720 [Cronobacter sakazakii]MCI0324696.1 hypothetical protein [Cronobacter sakazakii]PUV74479.1 hypothetical protein B7T09_12070 [Cronobacter sakazakii]PUV79097.1 hypothetical protein B7T08_09190 [Cronobacter sakazakii]